MRDESRSALCHAPTLPLIRAEVGISDQAGKMYVRVYRYRVRRITALQQAPSLLLSAPVYQVPSVHTTGTWCATSTQSGVQQYGNTRQQ